MYFMRDCVEEFFLLMISIMIQDGGLLPKGHYPISIFILLVGFYSQCAGRAHLHLSEILKGEML